MKLWKKMKIILCIFILIQLVSLVAVSNNSQAGILDDIWNSSKEFDKMGQDKLSNSNVSAENIINDTGIIEILNVVRIIAGIASIGALGWTIIKVYQGSKVSGEITADAKSKLGSTILIVVLINASGWLFVKLIEFLEDLQNMS